MTRWRREELIASLPFARRYARALSGSQARGDALVARALGGVQSEDDGARTARLALFRAVSQAADAQAGPDDGLSTAHRQLLLLTSLEELTPAEAGWAIGLAPDDAGEKLAEARERLRAAAAADVLIIEDEPIIAMDLEDLVAACGHRVVGVAGSEAEALEIAQRERPTLILADINLGSGGDGTHAVAAIMRTHEVPVIFVTAYPERLLTGDTVEPAFVITKPFEPLTLAIATYQAVTGGVQLDRV